MLGAPQRALDRNLWGTWAPARQLACKITGATLDDIREAVTTLEEIERTARRVLGGTHPTTESIELTLRNARTVLRARDTPQEGA